MVIPGGSMEAVNHIGLIYSLRFCDFKQTDSRRTRTHHDACDWQFNRSSSDRVGPQSIFTRIIPQGVSMNSLSPVHSSHTNRVNFISITPCLVKRSFENQPAGVYGGERYLCCHSLTSVSLSGNAQWLHHRPALPQGSA